ncbi:MAG: hypothetical protein Q3966_01335 [Neisseria sp.]|nr:hypothetical protein [Neisseria sp.]
MLWKNLLAAAAALSLCTTASGLQLGGKECKQAARFEAERKKTRLNRPQPSSVAQREWFEVADLLGEFDLEALKHRCREAAAAAPILQKNVREGRIARMKALRLTSPEIAAFRQKWLADAEFLSNNVNDEGKIQALRRAWEEQAAQLDIKYSPRAATK